MVQMHLVYHYTSTEDGMTHYEANMDSAYNLIRTGKVLEVVEERLGSYAAQVMSAIAYRGHVQIGDLETLPELRVKNIKNHSLNGTSHDVDNPEYNGEDENENATNGVDGDGLTNGDHPASNNRLHATLKYLAGHGYICRVRETHFQSLADNTMEAEREAELTSGPGDSKKQKANELEEKKREILAKRLDSDLSRGLLSYATPPVKHLSEANGHGAHPAKRRRLESPEDETKNNDSWDEDDLEDHEPMEVS
jgi:DNA-directed RNA polymerase III subunit RPC3